MVSGINKPNGILFDAGNNRLLFCQFVYNATIKEINLNDFSITTVLSTSFANFDGLAIDGNGNIYVSCWGTNSIYRYDNEFSLPAELVSSWHSGPADIFYDQLRNILAVPNYYSNHVDFIPITPADVDEVYSRVPLEVALSQNYPNPFNPTTTIRFTISSNLKSEMSNVILKVYDVLGNEVATLVDDELSAGVYKIEFSVGQESFPVLSSGIYFYQLRVNPVNGGAGEYAETREMILMK
jgi:hypothetical protein